jgi:hypothetical protein
VPGTLQVDNQTGHWIMKSQPFRILLAGLLVSGCGKNPAPNSGATNTSSSGNPLTAPVDYLGAVSKAKKTADKSLATVGIDQAIKMYSAEMGNLPKDLNELVPSYLSNIPPAPSGMKYDYDPKTGIVKVVPK